MLRTRFHGASNDAVEDAATGSASCALAAYLALHADNAGDGGKEGEVTREYHIKQGVEMGRESDIYVCVTTVKRDGDGGREVKEVTLRGTAVLVMEGSIEID